MDRRRSREGNKIADNCIDNIESLTFKTGQNELYQTTRNTETDKTPGQTDNCIDNNESLTFKTGQNDLYQTTRNTETDKAPGQTDNADLTLTFTRSPVISSTLGTRHGTLRSIGNIQYKSSQNIDNPPARESHNPHRLLALVISDKSEEREESQLLDLSSSDQIELETLRH
ncbi:hypothetical protein ElyMa_003980200 [Elysia marginata]|uniref:Uncharacterized protein n=1 Tax=Elysia marginata TaxID=1093978 RepID=A0AAV4FWX9_9GAST|nr:hypothetical protein ElyMa_003980200 [Elysia marginata]